MKNEKIKHKFINHIMKNGNKKTCENVLLKSIKTIQKSCDKSHKTILKLALINSTSTFRVIKLKRKRRKKKVSSKEIPKFLLSDYKRISWSLKFITQATKKTSNKKFYNNLKQEIITNSRDSENLTKIELHKQAVTQKRLFSYFRW